MRKKRVYRGCEMESPIYKQILREKAKGYQFIDCLKTDRIIRVKNGIEC
jgi:hypothetical protein